MRAARPQGGFCLLQADLGASARGSKWCPVALVHSPARSMARQMARLTALAVSRAKSDGMYADGGGLYLQVTGAARSWIYRYTLNGRSREMRVNAGSKMHRLAGVKMHQAR